MLKTMVRKGLNIFISILLLLPLFAGEAEFFQAVSHASTSFQKTCDMDDCNPNMPKCPLCPSFSSAHLYLYCEAATYLPAPISSFITLTESTLSDKGFVRSIFRPPTIIS